MHTVPTLCEEGHAPVPHDYTLHYTHIAHSRLRVIEYGTSSSYKRVTGSRYLSTFARTSLLSTSTAYLTRRRPSPPNPLCHLLPCCTRVLIVYNVVVSQSSRMAAQRGTSQALHLGKQLLMHT